MATNEMQLKIDVLTQGVQKISELIDDINSVDRASERADKSGRKLGSGLGNAGLALGAAAAGVAIGAVTSQIGGFVKSSIDAAARTEGLRNGLRTVIPDAKAFEATLAQIDKQARLPGLQKNDLLKFTTSLTAADLTSEQINSSLTILGSRMVGFGQTSAETAEVVGQFTQAMNRGKIEGDELNRLFETLPGFKKIITEMTGVTGGAQDLNDHFESLGLTVQDGMIPLLEAYDASLGAINHDAALTKSDAFAGALEDLQNTIGQALLPVYKDLLDIGTNVLDQFSALLTGAGELPEPIRKIKDGFDDFLDALEPLREPLQNLADAVFPLLKTIGSEIGGIFSDVIAPAFVKVTEILAPLSARIIAFTTPIVNLINTYLPPLVQLLKDIANVVLSVVLGPLEKMAGAFGWVIGKITDLINLIPGAKVEISEQVTAVDALTTSTEGLTTATQAVEQAQESTKEATKTTTEAVKALFQSQDTAKESAEALKQKQGELKVALTEANIELDNAKEALDRAVSPEEIETASNRVKEAIEAVKQAKIDEANTFSDESKKQIAILKANADAEDDLTETVETAAEKRDELRKDETEKAKKEQEQRQKDYEASLKENARILSDFDKERERIEKEATAALKAENAAKLSSWKATYDDNLENLKSANIDTVAENERAYQLTTQAALDYFDKAKEFGGDEVELNRERRDALKAIWEEYFGNKTKLHEDEVEELRKVGESIDDAIDKINNTTDAIGDTKTAVEDFGGTAMTVMSNFESDLSNVFTDFFNDAVGIIDGDTSLEDAFTNLGKRLGGALVDKISDELAVHLAPKISDAFDGVNPASGGAGNVASQAASGAGGRTRNSRGGCSLDSNNSDSRGGCSTHNHEGWRSRGGRLQTLIWR